MSSVIVISSEGQNLGLMDYRDAANLAQNQYLDLVEVGKQEHFQIVKIMNKGKWLYEKKKAQKKSHQHTLELKEVRFFYKTDKHDVDIKIKHIREFLKKGHPVQIIMKLKGRERQFQELAMEKVQDITTAISDIAKLTPIQKPSNEGSEIRIVMTATPLGTKTKNLEQKIG